MLFKVTEIDPDSKPAGSFVIFECIEGEAKGGTIKVRSDIAAVIGGGTPSYSHGVPQGQVFDVTFTAMKATNAPAYEPAVA